MFAWSAYHAWRGYAFDVDPPEWVLEYFDLVDTNLSLLASQEPGEKQIAPGIVAAVGFVPGGAELTLNRYMALLRHDEDYLLTLHEKTGPFNPFDQTALIPPTKRYSDAYTAYPRLASTPGDKHPRIRAIAEAKTPRQRETAAVRAVAEVHKVHSKTVRRALKKYPPEMDSI